MTDSIEWKWDVLHAPVSALVEAEVRLPRAPPQAAPLNVGSWFIQLSEDDKGQWELSLRAVGLTVQPRSLDFEYEITSPKGDNSIGGKLEGGSLSGLSETEWDWDIGEGKDGVFGEDEAQIELRVVCPDLQKPSRRSTAQAATAHIGQLMSSPQPFDVRFAFPKTKQLLWASSKLLMQESPYFSDLFSSTPLEKASHYHDSNGVAENGASAGGKRDHLELSLDAEPSAIRPDQLAFYSITVTSPSYSSLKAVLLWITTKQIVFTSGSNVEAQAETDAISDSNSDSDGSGSQRSSKRHKTKRSTGNLHCLPAISWSAAFRAAYLLKLPALVTLALAEYARTLTADNVARELFSRLSAAFLDVREVGLQFAVARWAEVKETEGMREMHRLVKKGKVKKGAEIALELASRL